MFDIPRLRFIILQTVLVAGLVAIHLSGWLVKPFQTEARWFVVAVVVTAIIGLVLVFLRKLDSASWVAAILVRIGIVGTIVGLIAATNALVGVLGGQNISVILAQFLTHIGIAFYVSLAALATNLWLELNIFLFGGPDAA